MDVKGEIVRKSQDLFMRYGIKSVSMDDIAREVGISKKTLYQHVEDKRQLVTEVFESHIKNDESACCTIMDQTANPIQQLLDLAQHIISRFRHLNPSTLYDIQKYYPRCWKMFTNHKNEFIYQQIIDNLHLGIKTGLYRSELNVAIVAKLYISLIDLVTKPEQFQGDKIEYLDVYKQLFDYHLNAIMSEEGRSYYNQHKEALIN